MLYGWYPPVTPPPAPCPEAVFTLTLKGRLDGQECPLTARGMTAAAFTRNLEAIRGLLDPVHAAACPAQGPTQGKDCCPVHHVTMKQT